ncbi:MAG: EamA family transporter RarD [Gammaproteobacteria bacterium]|nr:EamA family transporter RarD [Gammaproteobacteria bacterium]
MFERQTLHGASFATAAYAFWGVSPIYFKLISHVSPYEIITQRVIWSVVLLLGILLYLRRLDALQLPRSQWWKLVLTAALLSCNWFIFIYSVVNDNIVETSLGYFINPLVSVFLGMLFLQERLRPLQWVAIVIAAAGIGFQLVWFGRVPWLALALAFSFGFYGLTRKTLALHSVGGLAIETMILVPVALAYLAWLAVNGEMSFGHVDLRTDLLLIAAGFVTSFPLLCFAAAVNRLTLTAAGMFQYLAPTLSLIIAVTVYGEPFGIDRIVTFSCIWTALAIFTIETFYFHRRIAARLDRTTL